MRPWKQEDLIAIYAPKATGTLFEAKLGTMGPLDRNMLPTMYQPGVDAFQDFLNVHNMRRKWSDIEDLLKRANVGALLFNRYNVSTDVGMYQFRVSK